MTLRTVYKCSTKFIPLSILSYKPCAFFCPVKNFSEYTKTQLALLKITLKLIFKCRFGIFAPFSMWAHRGVMR